MERAGPRWEESRERNKKKHPPVKPTVPQRKTLPWAGERTMDNRWGCLGKIGTKKGKRGEGGGEKMPVGKESAQDMCGNMTDGVRDRELRKKRLGNEGGISSV